MEDLVAMAISGGPIVAILGVLSVASLALIVVKIMQLRTVTSGRSQRTTAFLLWSSGDRAAALTAVESGVSPADRITFLAMKGLLAGTKRSVLDNDLEWRGNAEMADMAHGIRLLELVAMVSPLLGLLGTVLGMIQSFQELALAQGAANASILAAGIWQALLTTAAGLIVAIPAAIAATLLATRIERAGQMIEAAVGQLFTIEGARH